MYVASTAQKTYFVVRKVALNINHNSDSSFAKAIYCAESYIKYNYSYESSSEHLYSCISLV